MHHKSTQGFSLIGALYHIAVIGFIAYVGLKIGPLYFENYKITRSMQLINQEYQKSPEEPANVPAVLAEMLERQFTVEDIRAVKMNRDVVFTQTANGWLLTIEYQPRINLFSNLDVVIHFNNQMLYSKYART